MSEIQDEAYSEAMDDIERLSNVIEATKVERDAANKVADNLKVQIARLKKWDLMTDEEVVLDLKAEIQKLKALITELADWIEAEFEIETFGDSPGKRLIQRAREATK